jgi:hypothetical protein
VVWQTLQENLEYPSGTGKRYIIGELERVDGNILLRYFANSQDFKDALNLGFKGFAIFDINQEVHGLNVMNTLERRIPSRQRADFDDFLIYHRINPEVRDRLSDFALLSYTGGKLPGDGFSFVHAFEEAPIPCELTIDVAGISHYKDALPPLETLIGSSVVFKPDPENFKDSEAIAIETLDGKLIGYVNRAQTATFNKWLQRHSIEGIIDRVSGTTDRPDILLYVKVI